MWPKSEHVIQMQFCFHFVSTFQVIHICNSEPVSLRKHLHHKGTCPERLCHMDKANEHRQTSLILTVSPAQVIRRACLSVKGPLLVFIKDADTTVCGNWDRYDAFVDSFGSCHAAGEPTDDLVGPVRQHSVPFMLMGGTALGDSGSHLTQG